MYLVRVKTFKMSLCYFSIFIRVQCSYKYALILSGPFTGLSFPGDKVEQPTRNSSRVETQVNTGLTVSGKKNPLKPKPSQEPRKSTERLASKSYSTLNKTKSKKPHIRNWNVRDDSKVK